MRLAVTVKISGTAVKSQSTASTFLTEGLMQYSKTTMRSHGVNEETMELQREVMCVREANDLVRNDQADRTFS